MEKEALKRIFEFLEEKEGHNAPFKWKLFNNIPLTKEDLNVKGDLDLRSIEINSLPEGLKVGGDLFARYARLSVYTKKELQEMIKTGFIKGKYYRKWIKIWLIQFFT